MKKLLTFVGLTSMVFYFGCSSAATTTEGDIPEWYLETYQDPNYLFATSSATSKDLQLAVDKATTDARADIGRQLELKLEGLQKRFQEEVGVAENSTLLEQFSTATKTVVSQTLTGSSVSKKDVQRDDEIYRAYVLVQYPISTANQALLNQIEKQEELYTRFRSSQAFKELEEEVKKMKEE
ncbi:MAG: LPP20 family lipoprotein [Melioribacteraceae bacterium]|nr:LPP20 family lipoprotein [Melioribacteraceae bacterium]